MFKFGTYPGDITGISGHTHHAPDGDVFHGFRFRHAQYLFCLQGGKTKFALLPGNVKLQENRNNAVALFCLLVDG